MKTFYVSLILSILLLVGGFLSPPLGIIDSSVLSAVGLLFAFATLALLFQMLAAIAQGRTFRLTKGDLTAEVVTHVRKLSCLILSFLSKTLQSYDNIMKLQTKGGKKTN